MKHSPRSNTTTATSPGRKSLSLPVAYLWAGSIPSHKAASTATSLHLFHARVSPLEHSESKTVRCEEDLGFTGSRKRAPAAESRCCCQRYSRYSTSHVLQEGARWGDGAEGQRL